MGVLCVYIGVLDMMMKVKVGRCVVCSSPDKGRCGCVVCVYRCIGYVNAGKCR